MVCEWSMSCCDVQHLFAHNTQVVLETGEIARQANGAIMATQGETVSVCLFRGGSVVGVLQHTYPLPYTHRFSHATIPTDTTDNCMLWIGTFR